MQQIISLVLSEKNSPHASHYKHPLRHKGSSNPISKSPDLYALFYLRL